MREGLVATLVHRVTFRVTTATNQFGEPTTSTVGPVKCRVEWRRQRVVAPEGEERFSEGTVFVHGPDLGANQVRPGDVVVLPDGSERSVMQVTHLAEVRSADVHHWELDFG